MLHTLVRVTVRCDTAGCPTFAERVLANSASPRALLAAVRRSLRRRDGWVLATPLLLGQGSDRCPACARSRQRDAGLDLVRKQVLAVSPPAVPLPVPVPPAGPDSEPAAARTARLSVVPDEPAASSEATQVLVLAPVRPEPAVAAR